MKLYLLFTLTILLSCTSRKNDGKKLIVSGDTLTINQKVYSLDSISKEAFNAVNNSDLIENTKEFIDDTIHVRREKLILTFHLGNGSNLVLKNDTTENYSNYVAYSYIESCRLINYWLLKVQF